MVFVKSRAWTVAFGGGPWRKNGGILGDAMVTEMGIEHCSWFNSGIEIGWGRLICIRGGSVDATMSDGESTNNPSAWAHEG